MIGVDKKVYRANEANDYYFLENSVVDILFIVDDREMVTVNKGGGTYFQSKVLQIRISTKSGAVT